MDYLRTILELTGLGIFLFFFYRALKTKIQSLSDTVKTMDKRLIETQRMADSYKTFTTDMPDVMEGFKKSIKLAFESEKDVIVKERNALSEQLSLAKGKVSELASAKLEIVTLRFTLMPLKVFVRLLKQVSFLKGAILRLSPDSQGNFLKRLNQFDGELQRYVDTIMKEVETKDSMAILAAVDPLDAESLIDELEGITLDLNSAILAQIPS